MHLRLSQLEGVPFYRQVEDQLADTIRAGVLQPGAALPSVRQLAADLLVSVITIKRAYAELEHRGLVVSEQGRGTFVARDVPPSDLEAEVAQDLVRVVRRARGLGLRRSEIERLFGDVLDH